MTDPIADMLTRIRLFYEEFASQSEHTDCFICKSFAVGASGKVPIKQKNPPYAKDRYICGTTFIDYKIHSS